MKQELHDILDLMTLEDKISLCSGKNFWYTQDIKEFNINSIKLNDGPHGVRATESSDIIVTDNSLSTCFPTASALAASWNKDLINEIGKTLGIECKAHGVDILLGPGINIKRTPLGGRNFEYYSEDPVLTAEIAKSFINGVQSQGIGTSPKHFICNETEYERMTVNIEINERALREIYLYPFEEVIKTENPWTIMASYNQVNGTPVTENNYLLKQILRDEWSYDGVVVSDWGAIKNVVKAAEAGMDLDMPRMGDYQDTSLINAVKSGKISETVINKRVMRLLKLIKKSYSNNNELLPEFDKEKHHKLAKKAADESIVLLKNDKSILPLDKSKLDSIAIIGELASKARYQGGGSSKIEPTKLVTPLEALKSNLGDEISLKYEAGYDSKKTSVDINLENKAVKLAKEQEVVLLFVGTTEFNESEGHDRQDINLSRNQQRLIEKIKEVNDNIIVIISAGSSIAMPWLNNINSVLFTWLSGQAMGESIADILIGKVNPSGKLSESFPEKIEDSPSYINYPSSNGEISYGEGVYVGYRYYEKKRIEPLFSFGYGLSYTEFSYKNLKLEKKTIKTNEKLKISFTLKNVGDYTGKETVQLYIKDLKAKVSRPEKELKRFEKVKLNPNESRALEFTIESKDLSYYNTEINSWFSESGKFEVFIGSSSNNIWLSEEFELEYTKEFEERLISRLDQHSKGKDWLEFDKSTEVFNKHLGEEINEEIKDAILEMPLELSYRLFPDLIAKKKIDLMLDELKKKLK